MSNNTRNKEEITSNGYLLNLILTHWIHEDRLYWAQVRAVMTIQFALIASAVALDFKSQFLPAFSLIAFGASAAIYWLARAIRKNRDVNVDALEVIANELTSRDLANKIRENRNINPNDPFQLFHFATHSLGDEDDKGQIFQDFVFIACGFGDLLAFGYFMLNS